jgi:hypothetical protein
MQARGIKRSNLIIIVGIVVVVLIAALLLLGGKVSLFGTAVQSNQVVNSAYDALSKTLGTTVKPDTHSVYVWTQTFYPDTSLGCPQPGQTYVTKDTNGYQVTITYNNMSYDFRAFGDGSGLFLCATVQGTGGLANVTTDGKVDEPVALVDAVFANLNTRGVGTFNRDNSRYFYTYSSYPDSSLGCPQTGLTYTKTPIFGWQILVKPNAGGSYDYRGLDAVHFWSCK